MSASTFCDACPALERAEPDEIEGVPLLAAGRYASPWKEAISRFKYGGHPELGADLARSLSGELGALGIRRRDALVPVPLHPARLAERGYNQSALVARALARAHDARFIPRLLERVHETAQQAALDHAGRTDNVVGAFRVRQAIGSGRVILVDDVVTTGATVRACLRALSENGVAVLAIAALARAKRPETR
jgi:ComF family protein